MLSQIRHIGGEVARALVVLALVFLGFAHTGMAAPITEVVVSQAAMSLCGDVTEMARHDDGGAATHTPCHACRIGNGADLPPPPTVPFARLDRIGQVVHWPGIEGPMTTEPLTVAHPRGPPVQV